MERGADRSGDMVPEIETSASLRETPLWRGRITINAHVEHGSCEKPQGVVGIPGQCIRARLECRTFACYMVLHYRLIDKTDLCRCRCSMIGVYCQASPPFAP